MSAASSSLEQRVLLLTPTRRDAEATFELLARHGIASQICQTLSELCAEAQLGAGALLVTQESIASSQNRCLTSMLQAQPPWSDLPLIVLTPARPLETADATALAEIGHMLLLQRPVQLATLLSTVQSAMRDRTRQYSVRDLLDEHTRQAAALVEGDRRKDEFLAVLAHELRNPLAPLRTGVDLLMLEEQSSGNDVVPMMSRQISHMVRLIDDLLDLSRISQGKLSLKTSTLNLSEVIGNAVEATKAQIESAGLDLHLSVSSPLPVKGDPVRLAQVFSNLLNNAAKYTDAGGHVRLSAERTEDRVVIRISDTGMGIPADMLSRVFEMFSQVDSSLGRARGGLGIGLTLVRQLVDMHGGRISAASEGAGRGSELTVELPLIVEPAVRPRPEAAPTRHSGPPLKVVIADDNVDAAATLGFLLKHMGQSVRIVHDGGQAVGAVCEDPPDLAIVDIGMPVLNGYEAASKIRERLKEREGVYLAALTGWGLDDDRRRAFEAGFDAHVVKPVETSNLVALLDAAAARRRFG